MFFQYFERHGLSSSGYSRNGPCYGKHYHIDKYIVKVIFRFLYADFTFIKYHAMFGCYNNTIAPRKKMKFENDVLFRETGILGKNASAPIGNRI